MPDDIEFDDINNDKGLYEEWKDEPISSYKSIMYTIDKQLSCFAGAIRKILGYLMFCTLLVLPMLCAGFMLNASYDAFYHHQTCSGPEIWAGMLQATWWCFFWWSLICGFIWAALNDDLKALGIILLQAPYWITAWSITLVILGDDYSVSGDAFFFVVCCVLFLMLLAMALWPFFAPLILAVILENRLTWIRYYDFRLFYNGYYFGTINPVNTTMWPSDNELYELPPITCKDRKCTGGWSDTAPRGVVGLIEDIIIPHRNPTYCTNPSSAPGFIKQSLLSMNKTKFDLGTVANCTSVFSYVPVKSTGREVYKIPNSKATFCSDTATMPECCDLVRGFFASQACLFIPLVIIFVYLAWRERSPTWICPAIFMVACGGAGFALSLDVIQ